MQIYLNNEAKTKDELPREYQAIVNAANSAIGECQDFRDDIEKEKAKRATTIKFINISQSHHCSIETNKNTVIRAIKDKLQNALNYQIPYSEGKISFNITQKIRDALADLPVGTPPSKSTWKRKKPETAKKSIPYPGDRNTQTITPIAPAHNTSTSSTTPNGDTTNTESTQNVIQLTSSTPRSKPIAIPGRRSSITDITAPPSTPHQSPVAIPGNIKQTPVLQTTTVPSTKHAETSKNTAVSQNITNAHSKQAATTTPPDDKQIVAASMQKNQSPQPELSPQDKESKKDSTSGRSSAPNDEKQHHHHHQHHHHDKYSEASSNTDKKEESPSGVQLGNDTKLQETVRAILTQPPVSNEQIAQAVANIKPLKKKTIPANNHSAKKPAKNRFTLFCCLVVNKKKRYDALSQEERPLVSHENINAIN